jgi:hypothetical protein
MLLCKAILYLSVLVEESGKPSKDVISALCAGRFRRSEEYYREQKGRRDMIGGVSKRPRSLRLEEILPASKNGCHHRITALQSNSIFSVTSLAKACRNKDCRNSKQELSSRVSRHTTSPPSPFSGRNSWGKSPPQSKDVCAKINETIDEWGAPVSSRAKKVVSDYDGEKKK